MLRPDPRLLLVFRRGGAKAPEACRDRYKRGVPKHLSVSALRKAARLCLPTPMVKGKERCSSASTGAQRRLGAP
jgi:hypothetical protein